MITWNVNSIRTRLERCRALLQRHQPDLLCLQETKVTDADFPSAAFKELGYHSAAFGQKTYNGVALLAREPLQDLSRGFPGDPVPEQARALSGRLGPLRVLNLYVVNGESVGSPKYAIKLRWLSALTSWLASSGPLEDLLVVGDFNVAPEDRDVHDPERWRGKVLCSDPERQRLRALMELGLEDLLRQHSQDEELFTWWDYRMGAFHRGWGLRIDLALGGADVARRCRSVTIDREERKPSSGEGKPSDHAPVVVDLD